MVTRVFVYGTLKEGFPNFASNTGTKIPGVFVTKDRYPFYLAGERRSPWVINTPGEGMPVIGEVYEVTPALLESLDLLERVGAPDGYERVEIAVRSRSTGSQVELLAQAYLKHPRNLAGARIVAGPFSEYTLEQAALYQKRAP